MMNMSIVEFVPKEDDDNRKKEEENKRKKDEEYAFIDNYPNLTIYDKIQILIFESYHDIDTKKDYSIINNNLYKKNPKSIPIPNNKKILNI